MRRKQLTNEQQLENILILNRVQLFEKSLRLNNMYNERMVKEYELYQNQLLGDDAGEYLENCSKRFNITDEIIELMNFMRWYERNFEEVKIID